MRLTYLWIQRFGKLKDREFFLQDGINIIYGANESGKSTLHSFIRGMLFGMPRYRGRASRTDPYTRYEPWERPADYAGSMKFITGGKEFRIDRNFYKNDVREYFVCETDGEQLSLAHGDLEALLGGMSENIYDNTVSIGQLRSETDEGMVQELQNYMANFEGAGSGDVDVQQAVQRLKKKKKEWESRKQEQEIRRQRQLEEMDRQIQYISQERDGLENQLENLQKEKITVGNPVKKLPRLHRQRKPEQSFQKKLQRPVLAILAGILLFWLASRMEMETLMTPLLLVIFFGVILILGGVFELIDLSREKRNGGIEEKPVPLQLLLSRMQGREEELQQQVQEKTTVLQNLKENREELMADTEEISGCDTEIKSLDLAVETLSRLSGTMKIRIGHKLQKRMEDILSDMTEGKYNHISMDENMKVTLYERNRPVALYQVSRGTVEQVYFALRMAVSEILCEECMPVLLDDVFAMYDEERLRQTLRWLHQRGGQTVIFTCHKREMEILRQEGIPVHVIEM